MTLVAVRYASHKAVQIALVSAHTCLTQWHSRLDLQASQQQAQSGSTCLLCQPALCGSSALPGLLTVDALMELWSTATAPKLVPKTLVAFPLVIAA